MKDNVVVIGVTLIGIGLMSLLIYFFLGDYKQNTVIQGLTETVRNTAIENADNVSRVERGELYIDKEGFEQSFKRNIKENESIEGVEEATYEFDYLENSNESIKGIRVVMDNGEDKYQATVVVDIAGE